MVADMRSRMNLFVAGLSYLSSKEGIATMLIGDMDIARLRIHVQQVEEDKLRDREEFKNKRSKTSGNESGQQKSIANRSSFQHKHKVPASSIASAPAQGNKGEYNSQNSQNFRARHAHSQGSIAQGGNETPTCAKCDRRYSGLVPHLSFKSLGAISLGKEVKAKVHEKRGTKSREVSVGGVAQPTRSVAASSSSTPSLGRGQMPTGRGRGARGAASSSGDQNRTYALGDRQNLEASPYVVTCTLSMFSHIVYGLIDPGSTLSYVTPLIAEKFKRTPKLLVKPFEVSTPIGESIIARRVYRNCIVTVCDRYTLADLVELEMVDLML
uniref:Gag-pol polyprotein n=1 Tax=Solanum tuberosum TaxID=4113 RepID=M1DMG3_SOLTU